MTSIRSLQLDALERVLKSASGGETMTTTASTSPWKVLVYDRFGRDLVSTLALGKKTLWRDHNVTLKMLIDSPRERVGDVTAVYFCLPTQSNLEQIAKDVGQALYDSVHLHFISPLPRAGLEFLAREVAKTSNAVSVAKVWDQHLGFVALERQLFTLHVKQSFARLNSAHAKDEDVVSALHEYAAGLVNVLCTLGRVPVIRCEREGPGKEVADLVTSRLHQMNKDKSSSFAQDQLSVDPRPLLLILDRSSDMCTPLQHSDGYQALVDDLLGPLFLNRLLGQDGKTADFVLDAEIDDFWRQHAGVPIPDAVTEQMNAVKEVEDKSRRLGGGGGGGAVASYNEDATSASLLLEAVSALPELTARKKLLETHGNVLRQVFEVVKRRGIHEFPELEARITRGRSAAKAEKVSVLKLLADADKDVVDKLRLAVVYSFAAKISVPELDEVERILFASSSANGGGGGGGASDGKTVSAADAAKLASAKQNLAYVRRVLTLLQRSSAASSSSAVSSASTNSGVAGAEAAASVLFSAADFAFNQLQDKLQTVANSVAGSTSWGPAARAVDAVCGGGGGVGGAGGSVAAAVAASGIDQEIDAQYLYYDPKVSTQALPPTTSNARSKGPFPKCIVFVVGGGCYTEHRNLAQYAQQRKRDVLYGSTEILSPGEFLKQMQD